MLPERPLAVALARVVVAACGYGTARKADYVRGVIRVSVLGTLFKDVAMPLLPRTFALHRDAVLQDPSFEVELPILLKAAPPLWRLQP